MNFWNDLDFLIVISSLTTYIGDEKFKIIKLLRLLKAIKPLRLISRNDGLKIALRTVMRATPSLLHTMLILFIFFILSGIFMCNMFKGTFYKCHRDPIAHEFVNSIITKIDCLNYGGVWDERINNFDDFVTSI